jgi:hypothetical protein
MTHLQGRGLPVLGGVLAALAALAAACSAPRAPLPLEGDDAGGPVDASPDAEAVAPYDGAFFVPSSQDASSGPAGCPYRDAKDHDGDGFSSEQGDCNDCDPNSNPGAFDVPGNGVDEDCSGVADDEPTGCDANVALDSTDAFDAVRSLDLCRRTTADASGRARTWGVVAAAFVAPDGTDQCTPVDNGLGLPAVTTSCLANPNFALGHGNLAKLGVNTPRVGAHMLGLSSGTARDPLDPGYQSVSGFDKGFTVGGANGYPAPAPACPGIVAGQPHDGVALSLTLRVPTNARSFSLSENFFSYEYPCCICSTYNDSFVVEMTPAPPNSTGGNIAFDSAGNPICVNNGLLQVCDAQTAGGKVFTCPPGPAALQGTGFGADGSGDGGDASGNHGATGWLKTTVAIDDSLRGKTITLLFAVWDSGDGVLDSSALIDGFTWSTAAGMSIPVTQPEGVR